MSGVHRKYLKIFVRIQVKKGILNVKQNLTESFIQILCTQFVKASIDPVKSTTKSWCFFLPHELLYNKTDDFLFSLS